VEVIEIKSFRDCQLPDRYFLAVDADGSVDSLNLAIPTKSNTYNGISLFGSFHKKRVHTAMHTLRFKPSEDV
jgi:hypothetical protein